MGVDDSSGDSAPVATDASSANTRTTTSMATDEERLLDDESLSTTDTNLSSTQSSTTTLRNLANFAMSASAAATNAATSAILSSDNDNENDDENDDENDNDNDNENENENEDEDGTVSRSQPGYPTLARSGSVPSWAKILMPFLCIACQVLFYYGQTEPMWKLHVNAEVDVWANATEYKTRRAFDVLGLNYDIPLGIDEQKDVQTFTYMYAIKELWTAKELPGTFLPRMAAVLLIIFSGLWPHIKLLMLNLTWFIGKHKTRRTRTLAWLAALGKWSLADVLVVCVMVGVLNLDWVVDPGEIKNGMINDLPSILKILQGLYTTEEACNKLLKMNCSSQKRVVNKTKCLACKGLVGEAFTHPEWARSTGRALLDGVSTSGGGKATLRVVGMSGIYYFCGAVIISIFLSLVVDIFDHRAKMHERKREEEARGLERCYRERGGLLLEERPVRRLVSEHDSVNNTPNTRDVGVDDDRLDTPLLDNTDHHFSTNLSNLEIDQSENLRDDDLDSNTRNGDKRLFSLWLLVITFFSAAAVYLGAEMATMERLVYGAGPKLLHEILGVDWERPYSFQTLMWTTGAAGGLDYMLMGTFGLFCVVGPVVRAVLLFLTVLLDYCCVSVANLAVIVNFLGSFCAWEVFAIATIMVQMLMPSITDTIIRNPVCGSVSDDGSCLKIEFNLVPVAFSMVLIGGSSMVGFAWIVTGRAMVDGKEHDALRTRRNNIGGPDTNSNREVSPLTPVMRRHHDYERLQGLEEGIGAGGSTEGGQEELVFETNQL